MKYIDDILQIPKGYIYIYGAGLIAELISKEIEKYYRDLYIVRAYVVSKLDYPQKFRGHELISAMEIETNEPVIIATLSNSFKEIVSNLTANNVSEIYCVSERLIRKIRSHFVPILHDAGNLKVRLNEMRKLSGQDDFSGVAIAPQNSFYNPFSMYITQEDFLDSGKKLRNNIYIYCVDWSKDWISLIKKAFAVGEEVTISFRSRFLVYDDFSLMDYAKEKGFKTIKIKQIPRRKDDYYTEDIIIYFAKGNEYYEYDDSKVEHYDIGLVGNWAHTNYGAELTYFALYSQLRKMGKRVLMISWSEENEWKPYHCTQLFAYEPYAIEEICLPSRVHADLYELNSKCGMFIHGSDQMLNPFLYRVMGHNVLMDWVDASKKKIGYALSFGAESVDFAQEEIADMRVQLSLFDSISVREASAQGLFDKLFRLHTEHVLDPVFLHGKQFYQEMVRNFTCKNDDIFVYLLDDSKNIESEIAGFAEKNNHQINLFRDAEIYPHDGTIVPFNVEKSIECWLAGIINSEFVITDSYHGMCLAIICNKPFVALCNHKRGATRFKSILQIFNLEDRLCESITGNILEEKMSQKIRYSNVNKIIQAEKEKSISWIIEHMNTEHKICVSDIDNYWINRYKELEIKMRDSNG